MSNHTKPPWPEIDAGIVDLTIEDYEHARKCVNIHDELVEALKRVLKGTYYITDSDFDFIRAVYAKANGIK